MKKKLLRALIINSHKGNTLDEEFINRASGKMNRMDLKMYLNGLKKHLGKSSVYIESGFELNEIDKNKFKKLYPEKQLLFSVNKNLLLGLKITSGDMMYNRNLGQNIEKIREDIERSLC